MKGVDKKGRPVSVDKSQGRKRPHPFAGKTLEEGRAMLARMLLQPGIDTKFAAQLVRTSRATLYRDASTRLSED